MFPPVKKKSTIFKYEVIELTFQFIMQLVTFLMYDSDTLECMFTSNEKCLTLSPSGQGQIRMNVALTLTSLTHP